MFARSTASVEETVSPARRSFWVDQRGPALTSTICLHRSRLAKVRSIRRPTVETCFPAWGHLRSSEVSLPPAIPPQRSRSSISTPPRSSKPSSRRHGGMVTYDGDATVDGVPGSGAPIVLNFLNAAGAKTGKLLPTGNVVDDHRRRRGLLRRPLFAARVRDGGFRWARPDMSRSESSTATPNCCVASRTYVSVPHCSWVWAM